MADFTDRRITRLQREIRDLESRIVFLGKAIDKAEADIIAARRAGDLIKFGRGQDERSKAIRSKVHLERQLHVLQGELKKLLR